MGGPNFKVFFFLLLIFLWRFQVEILIAVLASRPVGGPNFAVFFSYY